MLEGLKARAKRLGRKIAALSYAYRDPRTGFLAKFLVLVTLGYALSPIDLIPDFIPVLGWLDDLIVVPALIALSVRLIPAEAMADARRRAEEEPPELGKNWFFGVLFLLAWLALLAALAASIVRSRAKGES